MLKAGFDFWTERKQNNKSNEKYSCNERQKKHIHLDNQYCFYVITTKWFHDAVLH